MKKATKKETAERAARDRNADVIRMTLPVPADVHARAEGVAATEMNEKSRILVRWLCAGADAAAKGGK